MENRDAQNSQQDPITSQQNQQQPTNQQGQQQQPTSQNETDGGEMGQSGQSDTLTEQRSDTEGGASQSSEQGDTSGFIGQQGGIDSSSELVEDDQDFKKDGQGSVEGQ